MRKNYNKSDFITQYNQLKGVAFKNNSELKDVLGYKSQNSITEIIKGRQQISTEAYEKFLTAYGDKLNKTNLPTEKQTGVPFYDLDVTATITGSYMDIKEKPEYFVDFQPFNDCDAMTRVYGDSMYPKYQSGEIIAIKKLTNFDIMRWGETHLVITDSYYDDLRTIKNIYQCKEDDNYIILEASNPKYQGTNKILKKHILGLFLVKGKAAIHHM